MSYETKVIYDTSPDFGDNPQTIAEYGQPASVELQGLTPNTYHYTKAEIWRDGGLQNTSSIQSFTTLPAGTITLTHNQTVRNGYAYDVTYNYTSTYAPSWATLSTNSNTFQGVINSGNNTVSFHVTGLTAGTAYLTSVTMGDIYAETSNVQGSIVATVVNEITITNIDSGFTSVDVDVEYIIDGGYSTGWVDYWGASGDPSTDQPEGHEVLYNGAETVTVGNLTEGTAYKFRATIILSDGVTRIDSNVVNASTELPYAQRYFTIENASNNSNTIGLLAGSAAAVITVDVSTDNGTTWSHITSTTSGATLATLGVGEKLLMKHVDGFGYDSTIGNKITATGNFKTYGNIASLTHDTNFTTTGLTMPNYAFLRLFNGTGDKLIDASNLVFSSYSRAGDYCCDHMFSECTAIKTTPNLSSITTLDVYCYCRMFYGCSGLQNITNLPASRMYNNCYYGMYQGCTSITTPPVLNSTLLASYCYTYMFKGCTHLNSVPTLNATTLQTSCYQGMFMDCTSITSCGNLMATTLPNNCYREMFMGCTSLTTAPRLDNVVSIGTNSLTKMFSGCSLINEMYSPMVSSWNTANSTDWLENVAASGTMHKPSNLTMPTNSSSGIPTGWSAVANSANQYLTIVNTSGESNTIQLKHTYSGGTTGYMQTIYYSVDDGTNWSSVTATSNGTVNITTLNAGKCVLIKHTGAMSMYSTQYSSYMRNYFGSTKSFNVCGNIASLTHGDNFKTSNLTMPTMAFSRLFNSCKIENANNLYFGSYSTAGEASCDDMFIGCTLMTTAPKLPIKNLADGCYAGMFSGTKIETAPELPATTLAPLCYRNMFLTCTSLITPPELPATSLESYCYSGMFRGCTSLETAPELEAKTLAADCYREMFYGCTSLKTAPKLDNVTTIGTTSLYAMFAGCTLLEEVYAPNVSTWVESDSFNWLSAVAASGTVYKPSELEIPTDSRSGVPSGWSTEDY